MKKILLSIAVLAMAATAAAQSRQIARTGVYEQNGEVCFGEPSTTIAVDLKVECTETIVGPYARYAQKYLGVRAPLSDKVVWSITGAEIALNNDDACQASPSTEPDHSYAESQFGTLREFARLPLDRTDARALTADDAAGEAAAAIFSLRKHRIELITGEAGENVFGGGLESALKTLDAYETAYLELFFGKRVVTTKTIRLVVHPAGDKFAYLLGRFNDKEGLLPASDLSGEMLMLRIEPSGDTSLKYLKEATGKERYVYQCRVADLSTCILSYGTEQIASAVVPVYEFGRTVTVAQ